ncbi:MAG: cation diffusion facilitator family transporter, partial [Clostridiales bacterium]|nr:cation diffusion facilitator family transporter [Clostridiales bacterium]
IGTAANSVSITGDAINNLSDASSNIVTIFGAKLAGKPVDDEHPFGHGRMEYISALIVSFFIFLMGFELGKTSIEKIIHPESVKFSLASFIALIAAILVKLWMAFFNGKIYKKTNNVNAKAIRQDCFNDCIATSATIIALLISSFTNFKYADGIMGVIVAAIVIFAGIGIVKDIIGNLLGKAPDPELVKEIQQLMMSDEHIYGVHDLIVHDYGPGRIIASAHAEVPCDADILEIHEAIDKVEKIISKKLNIMICIHMDPIAVNNKQIDEYKKMINEVIMDYDKNFSFHDFRVIEGRFRTNIIFDLVIPHLYPKSRQEIIKDLQAKLDEKYKGFMLVITIEHSFI